MMVFEKGFIRSEAFGDTYRCSFILADERVHDVQRHAVAEYGQRVNFRHGPRQPLRVALEAPDVVHAAQRQAVEVAGRAGVVVVEQRRDADDFGDVAREEF